MSYDLFADMNDWSDNWKQEFNNTSPRARRWFYTYKVYAGGSDTEKNEAKEKAATDCRNNPAWCRDFPVIAPGGRAPFLTTGLGLELSWNLKTPFFSRSESEFDAIDNPVSRDPINGLPILHAAGVKGMLRQIIASRDPELADKLCGRVNQDEDAESGGNAGSVIFGDVEFQNSAPDIFSPHDHTFGVVDHPIFFEVAAAGSRARWGLMITALDPECGREDVAILLTAIKELLYDYGLSAKRSSGYGIAEKGVTVTMRPGRRIRLPEEFCCREGRAFSEPPPRPPERRMNEPEFFGLLSDGEKMLVEREQALSTLLQKQFPKIDKKNKKEVSAKKKFKAKWEKKDAAGKLWDSCEKFIEQRQNHNPAAEAERQEAYAAWEKRRAEHEARRRSYYAFADLESALRVVQENLKIDL